jgi:diguanylate cyclase (GGDEF)-like protein/PAS domain S-box-containing protein
VLYPYIFYIAVMLASASALILVWYRDRSLIFAGLLGGAHLLYCINPVAYWVWRQADPLLHGVGFAGLVLVGAGTLTLLIGGAAHLSRRHWPRHGGPILFITQALFASVLLAIDSRLAQGGFAATHTLVGFIVCWWLWPSGGGGRLVGVLMLLLGLNHFPFAIWGEVAVPVQTAVAAVLRFSLALALLYAAMLRSTARANRLKDRFFALTERSHQGVAVVRRGMMAYANPAFRSIYGMDRSGGAPEVFSAEWVARTVPESERASASALAARVLRGEVEQAEWDGERRSLDGRTLYLRFKAWQVDWDGLPALQVVVSDETERQTAAQALAWRSRHDELTSLPNRQALLERLTNACDEPTSSGFVLLLLDLDRFKFVNEAHGHQVGDALLVALADRLQQTVRDRAEVMRLGEDEFALLAPACGDPARAAADLTQIVRQSLGEPLPVGAHRFYIDVSMGVATYPASGTRPEPLLQAAHAAMHEAKRMPGTSVQFAADHIKQDMASFFDAEQALRSGLEHEEFSLVYQPKVSATSGQLTGFEALVRWDRPGHGRVSPLDFIPAAERTGLIVPLGAQILEQACRQQAAWIKAGLQPVPVAVNVSPVQLLETQFPARVLQTLRKHAVPSSAITLEITESAAVTHMEQALTHIRQLREQGVVVALDDFGTGFSSLNMLRSLPLQTVKIDRSLVDPMPATEAVAVVRAICDLASALRLDVVAEGVESLEHAQAAREAGCHDLQGFLYARPLEVAAATDWLRAAQSWLQGWAPALASDRWPTSV